MGGGGGEGGGPQYQNSPTCYNCVIGDCCSDCFIYRNATVFPLTMLILPGPGQGGEVKGGVGRWWGA